MTTKPHFKLTNRQVEILRFAAQGLVYKQIADQMNISYRVVTTQIDYSLQKNNCKKLVELIYKMAKADLI